MSGSRGLGLVVSCWVTAGCAGPSLPHEPEYAREETRASAEVALAQSPGERLERLRGGADRRVEQLERLDPAAQPAHATALIDAYCLILRDGVAPTLAEHQTQAADGHVDVDGTLGAQLVRLESLRARWGAPFGAELDRARRAAEEVRGLGRAGATRAE